MALALPGCGGQAPAAPEPGAGPSEATLAAPSGARAPRWDRAPGGSACAEGLDAFVRALEHLRRSLVIGVSYEQYVAELGTVRRAYRRVPVGKLDLACVAGPADRAERAFDGYLAAANTWGECVSDAGCETEELEPKLRRQWRAAADELAAARRALAAG